MQKWALIAAVVLGVAFLFAASIAAESPKGSKSPLFTFRMEQASSEMSFLPMERNSFAYNTEKGYQMNLSPWCGNCSNVGILINTYKFTCWEPFPFVSMEQPCGYFDLTCDACRWNTSLICYTLLGETCSTCYEETCFTCGWETCRTMCVHLYCTVDTCENTCWETCSGWTCEYYTC